MIQQDEHRENMRQVIKDLDMQFQVLANNSHINYNDKQVAVWNLRPIN